ncbi:MAG: response regulator transcription factor [Bacteroidota bacterium]
MIRILIVDDHPLFTKALQAMLERQDDLEVVGTAPYPEVAFPIMDMHEVDIVLMDYRMGEGHMNGAEAVGHIAEHYPQAKVLIISMFKQGGLIHKALQEGAAGFMLKESDPEDLLKAIHTISRGKTYFSVEVMKAHMDFQRSQMLRNARIKLTPREKEVLQLLVDELNTSEIADQLCIGEAGVETHRRHLRQKLDVKNTAGLIREAIIRDLVDMEKYKTEF